MIKSDKQFKIKSDEQLEEVFKNYMKSKNIEVHDDYPYPCGDLECKDCILNDMTHKLRNLGFFTCVKHPFQMIEKYEEIIFVLKQEIEVIESWKKENGILTKEEEKDCAEIRRLNALNDELVEEISWLYSKLDQMESGEKFDKMENGV